jgi:ribosomal protein L7/L12
MKLTQPSQDELIVSDFPWFTGGACALIFVSSLSLSVYRMAMHSGGFGETYGPLLGALIGGLGAWYFFRRIVVQFDRRIGLATWKRWSVAGGASGDIPLSDIKDVVTEPLPGNHGTTYRVALVTSDSRWPLTDYYVGNFYSCNKVTDTLLAFLSLPPKPEAASLADNLRHLVNSGKKIEAIKLVRQQRTLSLAEAQALIQGASTDTTKPNLLEARLRALILSGQIMEAIKLAHSEGNMSLVEAKQLVDKLAQPQ